MKIFTDNQGNEVEPVKLPPPCQSFEERMGLEQRRSIVAGPLSPEFKTILAEEEGVDRREFNYQFAIGNFGKAFAVASRSLDGEVNSLCKSFGRERVKQQTRRIERDKLADGSFSVSEYDAQTGALLRAYVSEDGELPAHMRQ